jgi:hypothetical protein
MQRRNLNRRGSVVAIVLMVLLSLQVLAVFAIMGSVDEQDVSVNRAMSARAHAAAKSGVAVLSRHAASSLTMPSAGSSVTLGDATWTYVAVPASGTTGTATVRGSCGDCVKTVSLSLTVP